MTIDKFSIYADPKKLATVREKIKKVFLSHGFDKSSTEKVVLAIDEACANIIRHSYKNNSKKKINIKLALRREKYYNECLEITLRDYGEKPDVKKLRGIRPKNVRPGGLGVYFMKKIMDKVVYDTSFKKGTKLVMIKNLIEK